MMLSSAQKAVEVVYVMCWLVVRYSEWRVEEILKEYYERGPVPDRCAHQAGTRPRPPKYC